MRCVKRSIGHLCHDEPKESGRGPKTEIHSGANSNGRSFESVKSSQDLLNSSSAPHGTQQQLLGNTGPCMEIVVAPGDPTQAMPQPLHASSVPLAHAQDVNNSTQQCRWLSIDVHRLS